MRITHSTSEHELQLTSAHIRVLGGGSGGAHAAELCEGEGHERLPRVHAAHGHVREAKFRRRRVFRLANRRGEVLVQRHLAGCPPAIYRGDGSFPLGVQRGTTVAAAARLRASGRLGRNSRRRRLHVVQPLALGLRVARLRHRHKPRQPRGRARARPRRHRGAVDGEGVEGALDVVEARVGGEDGRLQVRRRHLHHAARRDGGAEADRAPLRLADGGAAEGNARGGIP
mmetsp:Transcript_48755/g.150551  ORF Transcript_48755/g.150551 Transcript_48755/m.150551 type:complete len:228 (-) Transcript_48755:432-1115(-)